MVIQPQKYQAQERNHGRLQQLSDLQVTLSKLRSVLTTGMVLMRERKPTNVSIEPEHNSEQFNYTLSNYCATEGTYVQLHPFCPTCHPSHLLIEYITRYSVMRTKYSAIGWSRGIVFVGGPSTV